MPSGFILYISLNIISRGPISSEKHFEIMNLIFQYWNIWFFRCFLHKSKPNSKYHTYPPSMLELMSTLVISSFLSEDSNELKSTMKFAPITSKFGLLKILSGHFIAFLHSTYTICTYIRSTIRTRTHTSPRRWNEYRAQSSVSLTPRWPGNTE